MAGWGKIRKDLHPIWVVEMRSISLVLGPGWAMMGAVRFLKSHLVSDPPLPPWPLRGRLTEAIYLRRGVEAYYSMYHEEFGGPAGVEPTRYLAIWAQSGQWSKSRCRYKNLRTWRALAWLSGSHSGLCIGACSFPSWQSSFLSLSLLYSLFNYNSISHIYLDHPYFPILTRF